MKAYRLALILVCVVVLSQASGQTKVELPQEQSAQPIPVPVIPTTAITPAPAVDPLAADAAMLRGTWQVQLSNVETSKGARWSFADKSVTFNEGGTMAILPYRLQHSGSKKTLVMQLPCQNLTGNYETLNGTYTIVDEDTVFVQLRQLGVTTDHYNMFVLRRDRAERKKG